MTRAKETFVPPQAALLPLVSAIQSIDARLKPYYELGVVSGRRDTDETFLSLVRQHELLREEVRFLAGDNVVLYDGRCIPRPFL